MTSNKKHILITTGIFPPDIGGPASYCKLLGERLSKEFSINVITYSSVSKYSEDKSMPFHVVRVSRKIPKFLRHLVYFFKTLWLTKKADLVFSLNAISAGLPALLSAKIMRKKFAVKIVGDYAWEKAVNSNRTDLSIEKFQKAKKGFWIGLLYSLQSRVCKKADLVIVPSQYLADLVADWGVNKRKIKIIYNGIEIKSVNVSKEEARKKIGISGNIILTVGRLVPWKGFKMLIKIMPQLLKINQFLRLVIVGDGPEYNILQSMIKNLDLENKVLLVGKKSREDLKLYLAAADIFVLNTGYEGFSHQVLEAMALGVPVITTCVGGNREIIKQGENGFMVRYNDEFNLIEAIKTVWQIKEIREGFIEKGKETVKHFSVDNMVKETAEVFRNHLGVRHLS